MMALVKILFGTVGVITAVILAWNSMSDGSPGIVGILTFFFVMFFVGLGLEILEEVEREQEKKKPNKHLRNFNNHGSD